MYLAVDIGGTKTLIAAFSRSGRVVRRLKFSTAQNKDKFLLDLLRNLEVFEKYQIERVVVAIPGIVQKNCSVSFGNRNWGSFSLLGTIKKVFSCPIYFENDANLAAIYESYRIPGKTVFLTFSTGIGGGVAENGRLCPESDKFEPGHVFYTYNGAKAEWEDIAALSALEKVYRVNVATSLRGEKTMRDIAARVNLGLGDIILHYSPRTIVLGGPLGKIFHSYVKYLPKYPGVKYRKPRRPLESVIYGCYIYAKKHNR